MRFDHWRFKVDVPAQLDDCERYNSIRRAVVVWYRRRAEERLIKYVDHWRPRLGRGERSPILIRDRRLRWGSCARWYYAFQLARYYAGACPG